MPLTKSGKCDWFAPGQWYECMDPNELDYGVVKLTGCEVNCLPVDTLSTLLLLELGLNVYGPLRWVRPAIAKESRLANGSNMPVVAATPVRVPHSQIAGIYFEVAPCYTQADAEASPYEITEEHFDMDMCDCPWGSCPLWDWYPFFRPGLLPNCWWYTGNGWPPSVLSGTMGCQSATYGHGRMVVGLFPSSLNELRMLRLGHSGIVPPAVAAMGRGAATNIGVFCWGHTETGAANCRQETEWSEQFYNEPHTGMWDYCLVDATEATFITPTDSTDEWRAIQDAKSAALSHVATKSLPPDGDGVADFFQLDSARRYANPLVNNNGTLTLWSRSWNLYGGAANIEWRNLPVICEFPGSYMLCSGHSVVVEYVLTGVLWEMSFVPLRRKDFVMGDTPTSQQQWPAYPFITHRIELNMGLRVRFPDSSPRTINRSWLATPDDVELTLHDGYNTWPSVTPAGLDRIVYVDSSGRTFNPPTRAVWEGLLGFFSEPATSDVFDHEYFAGHPGDYQQCYALARGMDGTDSLGTACPAVQSHPEHLEGDRIRIWGGGVKIRFQHGT